MQMGRDPIIIRFDDWPSVDTYWKPGQLLAGAALARKGAPHHSTPPQGSREGHWDRGPWAKGPDAFFFVVLCLIVFVYVYVLEWYCIKGCGSVVQFQNDTFCADSAS